MAPINFPDGCMIVAVDDSPTQRYGRHVEGAGVHHNPTADRPMANGCTATTGCRCVSWRRIRCGGWAAYFCTDAQVDVRDILETIAARWAIEEHFRDVKEIWGAGQQQVRNIWSNIGCWHLNQWMYTLVELCPWDVAKPKLADRSHRPWDNPDRRPSHADRRSTIAREMLGKQFLATLPSTSNLRKFKSLIKDLISLRT